MKYTEKGFLPINKIFRELLNGLDHDFIAFTQAFEYPGKLQAFFDDYFFNENYKYHDVIVATDKTFDINWIDLANPNKVQMRIVNLSTITFVIFYLS